MPGDTEHAIFDDPLESPAPTTFGKFAGNSPPLRKGSGTILGDEQAEDENLQREVAPEKNGQEEEDADVSPLRDESAAPPLSTATVAAEFSGKATSAQAPVPVFDEPEFGAVAPKPYQRSAGSFSAESALEADAISPTER